MLITHLDSLAEYQRNNAWVWEHQALVRTRVVFGVARLAQNFYQLRQEILCLRRDRQALALEVAQMRQKMRDHLGSGDADAFNLKQDVGGMADIEFLAQYLVLAYSCDFMQLTQWSDNVRIFATAAQLGLLTEEQAQQLTAAYIGYRDRGHSLALKCKKAQVKSVEFVDERGQVQAIWNQFLAAHGGHHPTTC